MIRIAAFLLAAALSFGTAFAASDAPLRPDPHMTPGAIDRTVTQVNIKSTVCKPGYAKSVREKNEEQVKREVFAEYHINWSRHADFEDDHLISGELGGSQDKSNQWPQSYTTMPWNAHVKDKLEDELHEEVCGRSKLHKTMTLGDAQRCIAHDWIACYQQVFGVKTP